MSNEYFQPGATPATNSPGASAPMRNQYSAIAAGFDKLPVMAGNRDEMVMVNSAGTALIASGYTLATLAKQTGPKASLVLPAGNDFERDLAPEGGYLRYSTVSKTLEFFNEFFWGPITGQQGPQGPQGQEGVQGAPGVPGAQGVQGNPGVKGATGSVTTVVGSFALHAPDQLPLDGFFPANWDTVGNPPANLQLTPGQSMHYTGVSGVDFQTDDIFLFSGYGWTNLRGAQGPAGAQGVQGVQGPAGANGAQGSTGLTGAQGPLGATGPQGDIGPDGTQGVRGIPGPVGPIGFTGPQGPLGPQGPQGSTGPQGNDGATTTIVGWFATRTPAELPPSGILPVDWDSPGNPGGTVNMVVGQALSFTGAAGAGYDTGDIFVFVGGSWVNLGNAQGPVGPAGPSGVQGSTGAVGPQGVAGPVGPQGTTGPIGATGVQGAQGSVGPQGPVGQQGISGSQGAVGPQGVQGVQGQQGVAGEGAEATTIVGTFLTRTPDQLPSTGLLPADWDGVGRPAFSYQMRQGESLVYLGVSGVGYSTNDVFVFVTAWQTPTGWVNVGTVQGPQGDAGPVGPQGPQGVAGTAGTGGAAGPQGATGSTGAQGNTGPTGPVGMVWRGQWSSAQIYAANDSVGHNGDTWIATAITQGTPPPAGGAFGLVAQAGAMGATGAQGPAGPTGPQGVVGPQGLTGPAGATVASGVSFTPHGDIQSSNVQGALQELNDERIWGPGIRMHWLGQGGQPTWLFGGWDDPANINVFNPSNFSVLRANSSGSIFSDAESTGVLNGAASAWRMRIDGSNNLFATGNVIAFASDERLKENFVPISGALDKLRQITGYTFDWQMDKCLGLGFNPGEKHIHGVKAQEVQRIIPDAVHPAPFDYDADKVSKSGEHYLTVDMGRLIPLVIAATQELHAEVAALRRELAHLRANARG